MDGALRKFICSSNREEGEWSLVESPVKQNINTLCLTASGESGWAAGDNGVLMKLVDDAWVPQEIGYESNISKLWISDDGSLGWAVGDKGLVLRLFGKNGQWNSVEFPEQNLNLTGLWVSKDGDKVWVGGKNKMFLREKDGTWAKQEIIDSRPSQAFRTAFCSNDGSRVWAGGDDGLLVEITNDEVTPHELPNAPQINCLAFDRCLNEGWALASNGEFWRCEDSKWKREPQTETENAIKTLHSKSGLGKHFSALAMTPDLASGFAAGGYNQLFFQLQTKDGNWALNKEVTKLLGRDSINAIWISPSGDEAWAVGSRGVILRFEKGTWKIRRRRFDASVSQLLDLWVSTDGTKGWAVGMDGTVMELRDGQWFKNDSASQLTDHRLESVAMSDDGRVGWIVGRKTTVLRYSNNKWRRVNCPIEECVFTKVVCAKNGESGLLFGENGELIRFELKEKDAVNLRMSEFSKDHLKGLLRFSGSHQIRNIRMESGTLEIDLASNCEIGRGTNEDQEISLNGKTVAANFEHKTCTIKVEVERLDSQFPFVEEYISTPFTIKGWSTWRWAAFLSFLSYSLSAALCLVVTVSATKSKRMRSFVLHPSRSLWGGLFVNKYLIVDVLIRHFRWLRLGLFSEFRKKSLDHPELKKWKTEQYIPPNLTVGKRIIPFGPDFIDAIPPPGSAMIVLGPSGIGKSALVENIAITCMAKVKTVFILRFGRCENITKELVSQVRLYLDPNVSEQMAIDIVAAGGFMLLIDGLNEDTSPQETRDFIIKVIQNNQIVATSQGAIEWGIVPLREAQLEGFESKHLARLFDQTTLEEINTNQSMKRWVSLPVMALNLRIYLNKNERLPECKAQLLDHQLDSISEENSLDLKLALFRESWNLLKSPTESFLPGAPMPEDRCEKIVKAGFLTVVTEKSSGNNLKGYRFRHAHFHAFCVARWIERNDLLQSEDFEGIFQSRPEYPWTEIFEYLGELIAYGLASNSGQESTDTEYETLLFGIADLAPTEFKKVWNTQTKDFLESKLVCLDKTFLEYATKILAEN